MIIKVSNEAIKEQIIEKLKEGKIEFGGVEFAIDEFIPPNKAVIMHNGELQILEIWEENSEENIL